MTKTTKTILWIVVALIVIGGIWYGVSTEEEKETIKIGFVGPLTGDGSVYGQGEKNAVEMAISEINKKGGINGRPLKVIYEDGRCNGKDAVTAAQKLINVDRVKIILGGTCSSETLGIAPVAEENKVILFSAFSSNPKITDAGDFIFRNCYSDFLGGKEAARMIKERKIALITENTDYSQGIREVLKKEFRKLGGEIIANEIYEPGEKDFKTHLIKIRKENPEAIFINPGTSATDGGLIIKQIKELGINSVLYGNFLLGSQDTLEIAGDVMEGVVFFDAPGLRADNPKAVNFLKKYKENYPSPGSDYEIGARYDSVYIIAGSLEECGEDTRCIRDYLYDLEKYEGVIGTYNFDENGDVVGGRMAVKEIINGEPVERKE